MANVIGTIRDEDFDVHKQKSGFVSMREPNQDQQLSITGIMLVTSRGNKESKGSLSSKDKSLIESSWNVRDS